MFIASDIIIPDKNECVRYVLTIIRYGTQGLLLTARLRV